jgi:hypothetical protein
VDGPASQGLVAVVIGLVDCGHDRLGVVRIVLAALDIRLDVFRWQQNRLVPKPAQQPSPIMRGTARFQPDPGRCQLVEELPHFAAPRPTVDNRLLVLIEAVHLQDMLGDIQTNSDNRHGMAPSAVLHAFTAWHE